RFLGFNADSKEMLRKSVHFVLLDDSLSMKDTHRNPVNRLDKTCFKYAQEALIDKIAKELRKPNHDDSLILVEASKMAGDASYEPKSYDQLADDAKFEELEKAVADLKATNLHVNLTQ